jgi:Flp pilus assembly protein TadD
MRLLPMIFGAWLCFGQPQVQVLNQASAALTRGDYAAAERGFLEILAASPGHVDSLLNLGIVYARTGRLENAVTVYLRAEELQPGNPRIFQNLAMTYLKQEAYTKALGVAGRLIEIDRRNPIARDTRLLHQLVAGRVSVSQRDERVVQLAGTETGELIDKTSKNDGSGSGSWSVPWREVE